MEIITTQNQNKKKLYQVVSNFDFSKYSKEEIKSTIIKMRQIMKQNNGVGLSANQINLDWRVFVAELNNKFYVLFNPEIIKRSKEEELMEEGCLSILNFSADIYRAKNIIVEGQNQSGKKVKIKAFGVLARIFQHEIDHLNGKLITDYLK